MSSMENIELCKALYPNEIAESNTGLITVKFISKNIVTVLSLTVLESSYFLITWPILYAPTGPHFLQSEK
jgi:hypothetical protein